MTDQRILIIDDIPENLRVAVDLLEAYSFLVRTAKDGETGLKRARNTRVDLILLDIEMPGIDGYEVCKRLKADKDLRDIPVIFMTSRAEVDAKVRAFELGGVDYVTKPFEAPELLARVRTHLEMRALRQELDRRNRDLEKAVDRERADLGSALAGRESLGDELGRAMELVRTQATQIQRMTRDWSDRQEGLVRDPSSALRAHIKARLAMVAGNLEQGIAAVPDEVELAREHLELARRMLDPLLAHGAVDAAPIESPDEDPLQILSDRERRVLELVAAGKSTSEIAHELNVGLSTVSTYRKRIRDKTGAESLPELIALHFRAR